ncbi:hypothetical protein F511_41326 [Dorcoceras hygrometricum]|uniref:Uncharacterized protein n=1 Tax=Dorcoceras hygrometricum TaxID=472368 RepID=A0A2Z6ZZR8_9LAMI|nr:hypothetical protein F511_41326 [Dorcoceras hygrometricum]
MRCDVTRILVFYKIINFSSGPDLILTHSYTSILRLGFAAGDTLDAPITTSGPHNRALRTRCRTALIARDITRGLTFSSGVFPEEKIMPPRVQPVYASPSLNYKITENRGENLAQDTHQSRCTPRRDKCPQRIERRAKSPTPSKELISTV